MGHRKTPGRQQDYRRARGMRERSVWECHARAGYTISLYDLIAATHKIIKGGEDALVVSTVIRILRLYARGVIVPETVPVRRARCVSFPKSWCST